MSSKYKILIKNSRGLNIGLKKELAMKGIAIKRTKIIGTIVLSKMRNILRPSCRKRRYSRYIIHGIVEPNLAKV